MTTQLYRWVIAEVKKPDPVGFNGFFLLVPYKPYLQNTNVPCNLVLTNINI